MRTKPVDRAARGQAAGRITRCKRPPKQVAFASCDSPAASTPAKGRRRRAASRSPDLLSSGLLISCDPLCALCGELVAAASSSLVVWYDRFSAGSFVHAALLRDVRLQFHGLSLRLPASPHGAVPHHRSRRIDVCVGDVPRISDVLLRVFGAVDRRAGGSCRSAASVDDLESRARGFFTRLRGDH